MTQILDPIPSDSTDSVLCCYVNASNKIQVVRITNILNWYFERVVFPGQRLMFESPTSGQLEIHSGSMASSILEDTLPCSRLIIEQPGGEEKSEAVVNSSLERSQESSSALPAKQPVHS